MSQPSWGEWFEDARAKTKVFAGHAQIMAVAATIELGKQAQELREKLDLDAAATALMTTIGNVSSNSSGSVGYRQRARSSNQRRSILDLVYVTENLISMSFPYDFKNGRGNGLEGNDINIVSKFLKQKHGSHFMIWNVSEDTYDYSCFGDQVLEYSFPGHPAPPLGILFNICTSVESWLDADEKNVAVIHCLTGKGRTATLMACILTWIGECASPIQALQYVSERRGIPLELLTIPSQRRYVHYFSSVLTGLRPSSTPMRMVRIIINTIPNYSNNTQYQGCCPYIQIFQSGRLIATAASYAYDKGNIPLKIGDKLGLNFVNVADGSISFLLDCHVQGDVLIRCRHVDPSGTRVSIFRAAFHTGYIPPSGVLRLCKADLDGACSDTKFHDDFFVDLMFASIEENKRGSGEVETDGASPDSNNGSDLKDDFSVASTESCVLLSLSSNQIENQKIKEKEKEYTDRETLLWDTVAANKLKSKMRRSRKFIFDPKDQFSISDETIRSKSGDSTDGHPVPIVTSISNEELIMQIARLELYEGEGKGKGKEEEGEGEEKSPELRKKLDSANDNNNNYKNNNNNNKNQEEGCDNNEEGNNGENISAEEGEYDEDYYVSLDDIYPQETDFVTVNNMTTDETYQQNLNKQNIKINSSDGYKDDCYISESIEGRNPMGINTLEKKQLKKSESMKKLEKTDLKERKSEIHESNQNILKNIRKNSSSIFLKTNVENDILNLNINNSRSGSGVIVLKESNSIDGLILESGSTVPNLKDTEINMDETFCDLLTASIDIGKNTESKNTENENENKNTENKNENKNEDVDGVNGNKSNNIQKNTTDNDELDELERYLLNLNG